MAGAYIRKRERKDGVVYVASVDLGRDPITGKRRERSETFKTKREAKAALARWQTEIERGMFVDRSTQTVADLLRYWLETSIKHNRSQNTYVNYRYHVNGHLIPALGHIQVQKLMVAQVQQFYADKIEGGAGRRTVELCHLCLHRALDTAVHLGVVGRNVTDAVQAPKTSREERRAWSREEVRRFLAVARESHYGPVWLLMATTGMRRGEVLGLRWKDVNLDGGVLVVQQAIVAIDGRMTVAPPKRGKRRLIPLSAEVVAALREHRRTQDERRAALGTVWADNDLVFPSEVGTPVNARNLDREFRRFIERAGVPPIPIHSVRHTVATLAVAAGEDVRTVADLLGHNTQVLMNTYAHVLAHRKAEVITTISELVLGGEPGSGADVLRTTPSDGIESSSDL